MGYSPKGYYYPVVAVNAFDRKTGKSIWYASGVGCSKNPDVRVSSQGVLWPMLKKLDVCQSASKNFPAGTGTLGLALAWFTPDGDSTYTIVAEAAKGGPCDKAGVRYCDVILRIDGNTTVNKTYSQVASMLVGDSGSSCVLDVARGKKTFSVTVTRVPR